MVYYFVSHTLEDVGPLHYTIILSPAYTREIKYTIISCPAITTGMEYTIIVSHTLEDVGPLQFRIYYRIYSVLKGH